MSGRTLLYRGSLKSCNYQCSYCPFSKHVMSKRELAKDSVQWRDFIHKLKREAEMLHVCALMVTPYGEALLHPWYWEGLATVSAVETIDAIGAQTNLSFSVEEALKLYRSSKGVLEKLHLWATFHPEMISIKAFVEKVKLLWEEGVILCVGAVGVPEQMGILKQLRMALPEEIYLWINRMDGLKRAYTEEETEEFLELDPYFLRELFPPVAKKKQCQERLFVEGNGRLHTCNISRNIKESWEEIQIKWPKPMCGRKLCSCYLAYGGRDDLLNQALFGPYPLFRVPRRAKAVFLDIVGTMLEGEGREAKLPESIKAGLIGLWREKISMFFATTLPYKDAIKSCKEICYMFQGGIFAAGAHLLWKDGDMVREYVYELEEDEFQDLEKEQESWHYRILWYKRNGQLYKVTLLRSRQNPWKIEEAEELLRRCLPQQCKIRYVIEGACLQIVNQRADKASGVRMLCDWMKISPEQAIAVGDSKEDLEMMALCTGAKG